VVVLVVVELTQLTKVLQVDPVAVRELTSLELMLLLLLELQTRVMREEKHDPFLLLLNDGEQVEVELVLLDY
jgi:hypothetical protein